MLEKLFNVTSVSLVPFFGIILVLESLMFRHRHRLAVKNKEKRDRALEKIAHMHAHELRNPLTSIMGLIILIRTADNHTELEECLLMLERSGSELDSKIKTIINHIEIACDDSRQL